jgi:hypothetical protein
MQSFAPILYQPPTGGPFIKIAAVYDDSNGATYPIISGTPPEAVEVDSLNTDATGEFVDITFDGNLSASPLPDPSEFSYTADATPVAVTAVSLSAQDRLTLTLDTPAANGETLELEYTGTTLLSLNGVPVAPFGPSTVTNNVP